MSSDPLQHAGHSPVRWKQHSSGPLQLSGCTMSEQNRFQMAYCILLPTSCQGLGWGRISYGPSKLVGYQLLDQTEFKCTSSGSTLKYTEDIYTRKIVGYIVP